MPTKFVASTNSFVLRYWPKCNTPPVAARYLNVPTHPIRSKIVDLCAHRERKTLWWRVSVSQIQQSKRVVRSWCARRVRIAFEQALKQQGLDKLGKPLISESPLQEKKLSGTMDIYIQPPCVTQDFERIQKDAHHLLSLLLDHELPRK
ncbi:uncharacterized protein N7479_011291 [Penicillium vulpinum]|uniref:Uncharacterized protein n=1 Tax=Penicillium vulpinum TaxID=29845 RepID=A0A1V6RY92_9EURO|nr:uncharacterized protein N7479_011291 [Penicillium vulpinum]KAJ5952878.1 hypothetical protein N7479_011291 [Penicillium vulpinum]OQE06444.1 hypothetical protein PENVUL_c018G04857 [Penicillium vulpinum]